jgi:hypothetical protein
MKDSSAERSTSASVPAEPDPYAVPLLTGWDDYGRWLANSGDTTQWAEGRLASNDASRSLTICLAVRRLGPQPPRLHAPSTQQTCTSLAHPASE